MKQIKVYKIKANGSSYYSDNIIEAARELTEFDVGEEIKITIEMMDEDKYNNLPEFDGF